VRIGLGPTLAQKEDLRRTLTGKVSAIAVSYSDGGSRDQRGENADNRGQETDGGSTSHEFLRAHLGRGWLRRYVRDVKLSGE
jgi:hypothetical protein